jgi:hypothetical protein
MTTNGRINAAAKDQEFSNEVARNLLTLKKSAVIARKGQISHSGYRFHAGVFLDRLLWWWSTWLLRVGLIPGLSRCYGVVGLGEMASPSACFSENRRSGCRLVQHVNKHNFSDKGWEPKGPYCVFLG